MFAAERQNKILEMVLEKCRISVKELCQNLDASEATIRRDLTILEEQGKLKRTHGGAVALEHINLNIEPTYYEKEQKSKEEKTRIGHRAFELIEENDTLILDAGTTVLELAKCIGHSKMPLTVITNSITAAKTVSNNNNVMLYVVGGHLRPITLSTVGPLAIETLQKFNVNKAFIGTNGISVKRGLTTPDLSEARTKQTMIQIARETIVLADSTKFGQVAMCQIAPLNMTDVLITDLGVKPTSMEEMRKLDLKIVTV